MWPTTVWVVNLAFADLIYCLFYLSQFMFAPFGGRSWMLTEAYCKFFAYSYTSTKLTSWMSVAMVAMSRCIMVSNYGDSEFLSSKRNQVLIMIFLRIYGFICILPTAIGVSIFFKKVLKLQIEKSPKRGFSYGHSTQYKHFIEHISMVCTIFLKR